MSSLAKPGFSQDNQWLFKFCRNLRMRFEDLPPNTRQAAERAACWFLIKNGYVSLDEACQEYGLTLPDLWSRILQEAGLPDSEPPAFSPFA